MRPEVMFELYGLFLLPREMEDVVFESSGDRVLPGADRAIADRALLAVPCAQLAFVQKQPHCLISADNPR